MKLDFLPLGSLVASAANMRAGRKAPDVADLLPSVRARGVLVPILVRSVVAPDMQTESRYEIVAGRRRHHAACLVAEETGQSEPLPCAILDSADDAAAIEASILENVARLDPDEVTRWESFVRLVKAGRSPEDIAATFALPDLVVRRTLALGNLLPRIRDLYRREKIDATTVRHLTLASKPRQRDWLALYDDPQAYAPTGHALKTWLFGGQSIPTTAALFALDTYQGTIVADLFGEGGYFADPDQFWAAQNAMIEAKRQALLEQGWADVVLVPPGEIFHLWEHERTPKRKGGRVYLDISARGDVTVHEGYLTAKEARRAGGRNATQAGDKPERPELSGPLQTYVDLHRHAAARRTLVDHPGHALRLMVTHAICGSPLWRVAVDPQTARSDAIRESVEASLAEAEFDGVRRKALDLIGRDAEAVTVARSGWDGGALAETFLRLLALDDTDVLAVLAVVMAETLAVGDVGVELIGAQLPVDMARLWQPDPAFFDLVRDKAVASRLLADVAGDTVAAANKDQTAKAMKTIIVDHLTGTGGRTQVTGWVPRWLASPPAAYTERGGVGCVERHAQILAVVATLDVGEAGAQAGDPPDSQRVGHGEPQALAA